MYLHANVLQLESDATASRVTAVRVDASTVRAHVTAQQFVLAMGGMEAPACCCSPTRSRPPGLAIPMAWSAAYFLNHVVVKPVAVIELSTSKVTLPLYHDLHEFAGGLVFAMLAAPERLLRTEQRATSACTPIGSRCRRPGRRRLRNSARRYAAGRCRTIWPAIWVQSQGSRIRRRRGG